MYAGGHGSRWYGCVSTYAREEGMPGVLALLRMNKRSREADSLGLRKKGEEGVMALTSQAGLFPGLPHGTGTGKRTRDRKVIIGRVPPNLGGMIPGGGTLQPS